LNRAGRGAARLRNELESIQPAWAEEVFVPVPGVKVIRTKAPPSGPSPSGVVLTVVFFALNF
jgi:hypothetical protein